jgi:hypothetical protein
MSDDESTGIDHNNTLNDDVSYLFGLSIPCVYSACLFRAFIPLVYSACLFRLFIPLVYSVRCVDLEKETSAAKRAVMNRNLWYAVLQ